MGVEHYGFTYGRWCKGYEGSILKLQPAKGRIFQRDIEYKRSLVWPVVRRRLCYFNSHPIWQADSFGAQHQRPRLSIDP